MRGAAALLGLLACGPGALAAEPAGPSLPPVPRPAIADFAAPDQEQLAAARARLDALLAAGGAAPEALAAAFGEVGSLYFLYDLVDAAEPALANARTLRPEAFEWHYYLGALYQREGRLEEARASLDRALGLRPGDLPALVRLGRVEVDLGRLDEAERRFEAALGLTAAGGAGEDAGAAAALAGLGRVAFERGDPRRAIERLERALALQPGATSLHHQLGLAYRAAGELERARDHLRRNRHDPVRFPDPLVDRLGALLLGADAHLKRGNLALAAGRLDEAIGEYRRAAELAPDDPTHHYNLGFALVRAGRRAEAMARFARAIELDPAYRNAHYNLAVALAEEGRWPEAAAHYGRAWEIDPLDHAAHLDWALALVQAGEIERSAEELGRLLAAVDLQNSPLEGRVRLHLGQLRERSGDAAGALERYREAAALAPDLAEAHQALAGALGRAGRFGEAAAAYRRAVELAPGDAGVRFGEAMALLLGGEDAAARRRLEEGVAALPESIPLVHLLARLLATASDPAARDGERAVALARRVLEADRSLAHAETLAMALAEAGRFAEAAEVQGQVIELAEAAGQAERAGEGRRRLALYRAETPVRSPWRRP
jgi:tetratricopeptide (TPR) repeat protein